MVSEEQPMGSECCLLCPALSMSQPPQVVKEHQLSRLPCPLTSFWATSSQRHNSGTSPHPQSFWNASVSTPAPGCWDLHVELQGRLHAAAKGVLFCPAKSFGPSLAGPGTGLAATLAPKIR